jgi:integrase
MWRENGKQRSKTFNDRLLAKAEVVKIEQGKSGISGNQTFGELAAMFLQDNKEAKTSTRSFYKQALDNHLLPAWRDRKLSDLKKVDVIRLKSALLDKLHANTVRGLLTVATVVLNYGIESELVESNVAAQVKKPRKIDRQIRPLNAAEQRALIEATDSNYKMLFHLALRSGLRKGELLGLNWRSVDLNKGTIHVCEQFTHGRETTPKSAAGFRTVPIADDTVEQLKRWRAVARNPLDNLDLVFPSSTGQHQSASNIHHRQWKPALERAGLPCTIRFHDLRHTYASMMIYAGVPLNDLKVVLGHSDISLTANIYGHLLEQSHDRIRAASAAIAMPDAVAEPISAVSA